MVYVILSSGIDSDRLLYILTEILCGFDIKHESEMCTISTHKKTNGNTFHINSFQVELIHSEDTLAYLFSTNIFVSKQKSYTNNH